LQHAPQPSPFARSNRATDIRRAAARSSPPGRGWAPPGSSVPRSPGRARRSGDPRPIPGGIQPLAPANPEVFHIFPPGAGEPNTITDFNGFVGVAHIQGVGAGANAGLSFDVDNRFITGEYIALDGRHFNATFGFL
jgi:hypothetical protein